MILIGLNVASGGVLWCAFAAFFICSGRFLAFTSHVAVTGTHHVDRDSVDIAIEWHIVHVSYVGCLS